MGMEQPPEPERSPAVIVWVAIALGFTVCGCLAVAAWRLFFVTV